MTEWITTLRENLRREFGEIPAVCFLATIGLDGRPRARTMLLRELRPDDGALVFISDRRTNKDDELKARADAEVVFWLPKAQHQYRLRGQGVVAEGEGGEYLREQWWARISDASRALFLSHRGSAHGHHPATPRQAGPDTPMPSTFELILFHPTEVETLDVSKLPFVKVLHTRQSDDEWKTEALSD